MLGTSHTSSKTESTYDHKKAEHRQQKKVSEPYKSSSTFEQVDELAIEEKKLPLKPKPVKKGISVG